MSNRTESPESAMIPRWYAGRSILITGSTGFMGKVLVERLLATCPEIGRLFLLMRPKNTTLEKRFEQFKKSEAFDIIRERCPLQLDKLCVVPGDITQADLGISEDSLTLLREVSVVFHSAARLNFYQALGKAVNSNLRSVIRLLDICDRLPNIQAFVYVSTAFANSEHDCVEERVYPPPKPLNQVLALVDSVPEDILAKITTEFIAPKKVTYIFTKALAENAIEEHVNRYYPVAVFRPTLVVSSVRHPYPGWVQGHNGPVGVVVNVGKGLQRVLAVYPDATAELLPVDIAIDTLIAVAWETALDKLQLVRVYNCSTYENPIKWGAFKRNLMSSLRDYPFDDALWHPIIIPFQNRYLYKLAETVLQTAPLYVLEYVNRLRGKKSRTNLIEMNQLLVKLQEIALKCSQRELLARFRTDNVRGLRARLSPGDKALYNLDVNTIIWDQYVTDFVKGTRKYLLKEKDDVTEAKRHSNRLRYLHYTVMSALCVLIYQFLHLVVIRIYGSLP